MDSVPAEEIVALRARFQNKQDFNTTIQKINGFTRKVIDKYENKKPKKIKHHFGEKSNPKKRCQRWKHHQQKQLTREFDHSTVLNISNVPLSSSKKDLLLSGTSSCPKPSQIDCFQLKEDIQHYFRRLQLKEFFHESDGENEPIP